MWLGACNYSLVFMNQQQPVAKSYSEMIRNVLLVFGGILFAVLSLSPNGATRIYLWPWSFYTQVLMVVPLGVLFVSGLSHNRPRVLDSVARNLSILLVLGFLLVSSILSTYWRQSIEAFLLPLFGVGVFYVSIDLMGLKDDEGVERRFKRLTYLLGGFFGVFLIVSFVSWGLELVGISTRLDVRNELLGERFFGFDISAFRNERPLGHSNYTAGMAVLMLPWFASLAWFNKGMYRVTCVVLFLLSLFLLWSTGSRGGLLGLGVSLISLVVLLVESGKIGRKWVGLWVFGSIIAVAVIGASSGRVRSLVSDFSNTGMLNSGDVQRTSMVQAGWEMGKDRLWTGNGLGTVSRVYPEYRSGVTGGVESALQLHSLPVQVWATLGLPGVVALLASFIYLGWCISRGLRKAGDGGGAHCAFWGSSISLIGYLAFSLTDYQLDIPLFVGILAMNAAIVCWVASERNSSVKGSYVLSGGVGIVLVVLAVVLYPSIHSRATFASGVNSWYAGEYEQSRRLVEETMESAPWEAFYLNQAAFMVLGEKVASPVEGSSNEKEAVELLRLSLQANPHQEICHFNLAWMLLDTNLEGAIYHFGEANRLVPGKSGINFGLGLCYLRKGELAASYRYFALEWLNDPSFAMAPIWSHPSFMEHRPKIFEEEARWVAQWREDGRLSEHIIRQIEYVAALHLWWYGDDTQIDRLIETGGESAQVLFETIKMGEEPSIESMRQFGWMNLYRAWKLEEEEGKEGNVAQNLGRELLKRYSGGEYGARMRGVESLLSQDFSTFEQLLRSPEGTRPPVSKSYHRTRTAYGILFKNMDGINVVDRYRVEENGIFYDFLRPTIPYRGYIPTSVLWDALIDLEPVNRENEKPSINKGRFSAC